MSVYLDYNASTPIDKRVLEYMTQIYLHNFGNADSRTHSQGQLAKGIVDNARERIANLLMVEPREVLFTSGATESDNIAIQGLYEYAVKSNKKHIVTTAIEHKAVLETVNFMMKKGFEVDFVKPDINGAVSVENVLSRVRNDTLLVSVMHANNETGIIQPVIQIGEELSKKEVLFHIDAAQSFGKLVTELQNCKYDMLSISGHKLYAPQGIGALILRFKKYKRPPIKQIMFGGGQEFGIRPGTVPVALIGALGKIAEIAYREHKDWYKACLDKKKRLIQQLDKSGVKYQINGDQNICISNTINISFTGIDSEALMLCTKNTCSVSNGSACASHDYKPSHVLLAMGLPMDRIESAIRFSWGHDTDIDISSVIDCIKKMQ